MPSHRHTVPSCAEMQLIAAGIIRHRLQLGMSHQQLADRAGVTRPAISYIESGRRTPTLLTFVRIALAFGLPPSKLLEECSPPTYREH